MTDRNTLLTCAVVAAIALTTFGLLRRREAAATSTQARVAWLSYDVGVERAQKSGKRVLVEFSAAWCAPCRMLDRKTFSRPRVVRAVQASFVPVRVDVDRDSETAEDFMVMHLPTLAVLTPAGERVNQISGYVPPGRFLEWLEEARTHDPARWPRGFGGSKQKKTDRSR